MNNSRPYGQWPAARMREQGHSDSTRQSIGWRQAVDCMWHGPGLPAQCRQAAQLVGLRMRSEELVVLFLRIKLSTMFGLNRQISQFGEALPFLAAPFLHKGSRG